MKFWKVLKDLREIYLKMALSNHWGLSIVDSNIFFKTLFFMELVMKTRKSTDDFFFNFYFPSFYLPCHLTENLKFFWYPPCFCGSAKVATYAKYYFTFFACLKGVHPGQVSRPFFQKKSCNLPTSMSGVKTVKSLPIMPQQQTLTWVQK